MDLSQLRHEFRQSSLNEQQVDPDPIRQFSQWFEQAMTAQCPEPNAMSLATVNVQGHPSVRIVYLKGIESGDFLFFTNTLSRKGRELDSNPCVSALLFWPCLERQIRIEGQAFALNDQVVDDYFATRPRMSQWGAWASKQSEIISSREALDKAQKEMKDRYPDEVPRPPYWGGYRIEPTCLEFWQGRPGRLHDRLQYRKEQGQWILERLSP